MSLDDGSVEIDVGSQLGIHDNAGNYAEIEEIRQELLEEGIIAELDDGLQFIKPYTVYSKFSNSTALSMAASIILHGSRNGWTCWKNSEGVALGDIQEIRNLFS